MMRLLVAPPLLALAGCLSTGTAATREATPAPARVLTMDLSAQVGARRDPARWEAQATLSEAVPPPSAVHPSGHCHPIALPPPEGAAGPAVIELTGPLSGTLGWDDDRQAWRTRSTQTAVDPGWAVGSLRWVDPDGVPREAVDAVRFGAVPTVLAADRRSDGSVELRWDVLSVDSVSLTTTGPAGALECGANPDGAVVPWWAVPASGGEIRVRSTRERVMALEAGLLVVVRATIERLVPLDRPADWAQELTVPPPRPFDRPRGPRRSTRTPPPHTS